MKSQRRHELQTNELADSIGHLIERAKAHARPLAYGGVFVVAVIVLLVVYPMVKRGEQGGVAAQFAGALYSGDVNMMRDFVMDFPDAKQAPLARLTLADRLLGQAVRGVDVGEGGEDAKAKAARYLAEAKELYNGVAKAFPEHEGLARVGLALVTIQEGDIAQGTAVLDGIGKTWPNSAAAAKAKVHLQALAGYKPVEFSNAPLEEEKPPEVKEGEGGPDQPKPDDAKPTEPKGDTPADIKPKG